MSWTKSKGKFLAGLLVLSLILVAVAVKLWFFPSLKDAYFAVDWRSLRRAPAGLVVLRPTRFPFLRSSGIMFDSPTREGGGDWRMMGRNVSLRELIAVAYDHSQSRVSVPTGARAGHYDFLVTVATNQRPRLQAVIRRKLGYVAQKETRETEVLALKIENAKPPCLTASDASEKENVDFDDIRVRFTHAPLTVVADVLGQILPTPVVDKTGLTNVYDYSIAFDTQTRRHLRDETTARAAADTILEGLGLALEPDTATLEMLVAKKAK